MFKPHGIIPAMVTPFDQNGKVNETALRRLAGNMTTAGCHGLFVLGSNGEFFSLSNEEKVEIARIVVDEVNGQIPVYAGTGGNSTEETIMLTRQMEEAGVTAVSVITPYFVKLTQDELKQHFESIAEAVNLPIILYDIPGMTGNPLAPTTVKELSKVPNIVAIKDSSGSFDNVLKNLEAQGPDFTVLVGTDSLILPALMAGGGGAIAATANLLPKVVVSIYEKWNAGDHEGAELQQRKLRAIRNAFGKGTLPSVLKQAMNSAGLEVGPPRLPVKVLPESVKLEVEAIVDEYRLDGDVN